MPGLESQSGASEVKYAAFIIRDHSSAMLCGLTDSAVFIESGFPSKCEYDK